MNMTYAGTGVNYGTMDLLKRSAQAAGADTDEFIRRFGFSVVGWSRGESVFVIKTAIGYFGLVIEGLGTKNLVADLYREVCEALATMGKTFFDHIGQCNAAMAFNDMCVLGLRPIAYGQYLAMANGEWPKDELRRQQLIEGTKLACVLARCPWGCGETTTLSGIIVPGTVDLAGATIGFCPTNQLIDPASIQHGDTIVIIESSGIHANGLTLARKIADKLPEGYLTKLPDGRTYGETLLDPTHIYVGLVEDCLNAGVEIHYVVNVTGHGWRKFMRAPGNFTYVIETLPRQLLIFDFIQQHGPVDDDEAYGNLNMGGGFALYVPGVDDAEVIIQIAGELGLPAFVAGHIEAGDRKVVIEPKGLVYGAETLEVR